VHSSDNHTSDIRLSKRTSQIEYTIITNNLASLYELREVYDIWDVLDLYEIALVNVHNKAAILQRR